MNQRTSDTAGVPHVILNFVVDVLIRDRNSLALEVEIYWFGQKTDFGDLEYETFWAMSLVHRTWTDVVRRGLWHRATVDLAIAKSVPRNSLRCHIRDLAISLHQADNAQYSFLSEILFHAPNLQELYVDIGHLDDNLIAFFRQLGAQSCLRRLWIMGEIARYQNDICVAVSCLTNLKSLVVECWDADSTQSNTLHALDSPPETLESLAILARVGPVYVDWLSKPRGKFAIRDLAITLYLDEFKNIDSFMAHIEGCAPFLKSFHVMTPWWDAEAVHLQEDILNLFLSKATCLQCFTLTLANRMDITNLCLPETLTELHIRHPGIQSDENIASIVASSRHSPSWSHLKKLVIAFGHKSTVATLSSVFSKTMAICRDTGISLSFEYIESVRFNGDVMHNPAFVD